MPTVPLVEEEVIRIKATARTAKGQACKLSEFGCKIKQNKKGRGKVLRKIRNIKIFGLRFILWDTLGS